MIMKKMCHLMAGKNYRYVGYKIHSVLFANVTFSFSVQFKKEDRVALPSW